MLKQYKNILLNREDAADKLKEVLPMCDIKEEKWEFIALSHGGLELVSYLTKNLDNNKDILFSETVCAPQNSNCEIARVSETEEIVINEDLVAAFEIQYDYIYGEAHRKHEEKILSYIYQYRKGHHFPSLTKKTVLLVDEGSETGMKMMSALKTILLQKPKAVYIAVPVLPRDVLELLEPYADEIFFLYDIEDYVETSLYYKELNKLSDEDVEKLLQEGLK